MIKHQVDDYARDRYVEPHWKSPARNSQMARELAAKSAGERHDDEGHDYCRENRVRNQNREVERFDPPCSWKASRPVMVVINQVRNQKENRTANRRDHAGAMSVDALLPYKEKPREYTYCARCIQNRIKRGEQPYCFFGHIDRYQGLEDGGWLLP